MIVIVVILSMLIVHNLIKIIILEDSQSFLLRATRDSLRTINGLLEREDKQEDSPTSHGEDTQ